MLVWGRPRTIFWGWVLLPSKESNPALLREIADRRERDEHGNFAPRDPSKPRELSQAQKIAIKHLSWGKTKAYAAKQAGVCAVTVTNWYSWPEFRSALMAASEEFLAAAVPDALNLLHKQVTDKKLNAFARQNAARDLLDRVGIGRRDDAQATQIIVEVSASMPTLGQAREQIVEMVDAEAVQQTLNPAGRSSNPED